MKLRIDWTRPIQLRDVRRGVMIYNLDLSKVDDAAGIYIFGRQWGRHFEALYVGKASNIRARVKGHLNNLRLMRHLHDAKTGKRVLLAGRLVTKRGQRLSKCLALAERALIRYLLSKGHDLVNKQGTELRRHQLEFSGRYPKRSFPTMIYLEKTKGE